MSKYPGLEEALAVAGNVTSYPTAFARLDHGWSMKRATETPTRMRGKRKSWTEKRESNRAARDARIAARVAKITKPLRQQTGRHWNAEDSAPERIRTLRAAYCASFMAGSPDETMALALRDYAEQQRGGWTDASHNSKVRPRGVSTQPAYPSAAHGRAPFRSVGSGDDEQFVLSPGR